MIFRLGLLSLLFIQCASPLKVQKRALQEAEKTVMKFVPGAGGGRGVDFRITLQDTIEQMNIVSFSVNDVDLEPHLRANQIEATIFYADPERTVDNEDPPLPDPVLYNAEEYSALLIFEANGKQDSIRFNDFKEIEAPLYP